MNLYSLLLILLNFTKSQGISTLQNSAPQDAASSAPQNNYKEAHFVYPQGVGSRVLNNNLQFVEHFVKNQGTNTSSYFTDTE